MIVKMNFLSIAGPKADIDRVAEKYLSKYEIYLENTLSELKGVKDLKPFMEINPYKDALTRAKDYINLIDVKDVAPSKEMSLEDSLSTIKSLDKTLDELKNEKSLLEEQREKLRDSLKKIEPFRQLHGNISSILHFNFIKYRFGKISHEHFNKFKNYVYQDLETIFYECNSDEHYVWGVYFVTRAQKDRIDAIYSSLHFERTYLPDEYEGTPEEAYTELDTQIMERSEKITSLNKKMALVLEETKQDLLASISRLESFSTNFDVRKMAACTSEYHEIFYILCGWMSEKDSISFQKEVENDPKLFVIIQDDHNEVLSQPPTMLKNPKVFKPFESFVKMYGLPAYNEIDPTIFLGLTYVFIFGCMFGDAGQGILLILLGSLLYKFKKMDLGAIIAMAGVFSTIFGVLYGSFFGFEDVIPALWLRPMERTVTLPVVGTLNTVLVLSVGFGMALILIAMIMNIMNGIRQKNIEKIFFDTNGIPGMVFYGSVVLVIVLMMTGNPIPGGILLAVSFGVPLILMAFKEPIIRALEKKKDILPEGKALFLVQTIFELFEVVLSYMTNTISFVRIGAFALSHAGMMQVVLMLAGAEHSGTPNWIVVILGNLFVMGMEGLIVGIHVLRLEYYEMFSRFFSGSGREFKPYAKVTTK